MTYMAEQVAQNALTIGRKKILSPCYGCADRKVSENYNCHIDCEKYIKYKNVEVRP